MEQRERFIRDHQLALYTMVELSARYGIAGVIVVARIEIQNGLSWRLTDRRNGRRRMSA
jgi:hypothetical protein